MAEHLIALPVVVPPAAAEEVTTAAAAQPAQIVVPVREEEALPGQEHLPAHIFSRVLNPETDRLLYHGLQLTPIALLLQEHR